LKLDDRLLALDLGYIERIREVDEMGREYGGCWDRLYWAGFGEGGKGREGVQMELGDLCIWCGERE
jgi:hypothetical protein